MTKSASRCRCRNQNSPFWSTFVHLLAVALLLGVCVNIAAAESAMTESQVKALCVLNFAKYVTWPDDSGVASKPAMRIGIIGSSKLSSDLKSAAQGKIVSGKPIQIIDFNNSAEIGDCDLLFVGGSDKDKILEALSKVKNSPVLTVGEDERFAEAGGIINFVVKENKVRFEVDLAAARQARVQISSKLLNLADKVRGKQ